LYVINYQEKRENIDGVVSIPSMDHLVYTV